MRRELWEPKQINKQTLQLLLSKNIGRTKIKNPSSRGEEVAINPPPLCGRATLTGWGFYGVISQLHNCLRIQVKEDKTS